MRSLYIVRDPLAAHGAAGERHHCFPYAVVALTQVLQKTELAFQPSAIQLEIERLWLGFAHERAAMRSTASALEVLNKRVFSPVQMKTALTSKCKIFQFQRRRNNHERLQRRH